MEKNGLILEGGGMRGLFSAGVIDVLMEEGVAFDGLVGVSAGAAFGCNYKSRQPGRAIRYNTRFAHDWRYCSWRSWLKTGDVFGAEFCYHEMPERLDRFDTEAFNNNPMEFHVVCTDVTTGKAFYKQLKKCSYDSYEYIRASASMPFVSKIVEINGTKLLDGGVADSIPLRYFQDIGYGKNLVVLTQPRGYVKGHNRLMPLMRFWLRKYPLMVKALDERHVMYNRQVEYVCSEEQQGRAFVVRPPQSLGIKNICNDANEMKRVYEVGRTTAHARLDDLIKYLESK